MIEFLVLVWSLIEFITAVVGIVYLSLALAQQVQKRGGAMSQSYRYARRGLAYATFSDLFWVLHQMAIVYTEGATNGNLTWLLVATISLLFVGYLWWNQDK